MMSTENKYGYVTYTHVTEHVYNKHSAFQVLTCDAAVLRLHF